MQSQEDWCIFLTLHQVHLPLSGHSAYHAQPGGGGVWGRCPSRAPYIWAGALGIWVLLLPLGLCCICHRDEDGRGQPTSIT
jgi:hypothetical protein